MKAGAKGLIDLGVKALKDTAKLPNEVLKSIPIEKELSPQRRLLMTQKKPMINWSLL